MANLVIAGIIVAGVAVWLRLAARRDARGGRDARTAGRKFSWRPRRGRVAILAVAVAVALIAGSGLIGPGGGEDEPTGLLAILLVMLGFGALIAGLIGLGWLATWTSRRRLQTSGENPDPVILRGRRLTVARAAWLTIFTALVVVFVANLGGLWAEASRVRFGRVPWDEFLGEGWYSLSVAESRLLSDSSIRTGLSVPAWYPWMVVLRQAAVYAGVVGLAWFVFSRRPRHWMAFYVSIFIPVAALATVGSGGTPRLDEIWLPLGFLGGVLQVLALLAVGAFLWVFPDGRFRGTYARYLAVLVLVGFPLALWAEAVAWLFGMLMVGVIVAGGIATQVFRYRYASPTERREARWILAMLVLLAAWLTGGTALSTVFGDANEVASGWPGFVWRQAHVTLYVATPLLAGLLILWLVRRQGWWDLDLFVNRSMVLAVVAPVLGAVYLGVVLGLGAAVSAWTDQNGTALAVVAATIVVAIAYQPTRRRVQAAIDRRFFAERARAAEIVDSFDAALRSDVDQEAVRTRILTTVEAAFEPGVTTLWLRPAPDATGEAR